MRRHIIYIIYEDKLPIKVPNQIKISEKLRNGTPLTKELDRELFNLIHGSLGTKIQIAKRSMEELKAIGDKMGPKRVEGGRIAINTNEFLNFNRELDIFLFELYSVFDVFSREIDLILGPWINKWSNFSSIKNELEKNMRDDEITNRTIEVWDSDWFTYLRKLRNRITHRYGIVFSTLGPSTTFYLPDDPDTYPSLNNRMIKVIPWCQLVLENSLSYINELSGLLGLRIFSDW